MKKQVLALSLAAAMIVSAFSGCGQKQNQTPTESSAVTESSVVSSKPSLEETYEKKHADVPSFNNLVDLKDYLVKSMSEGNFEPEFYYFGDEVVDAGSICRMAAAAYCYIDFDGNDPLYKRARIAEYPGNRIVRAHQTNDLSILNDEEKEALEVALKVVEEAKAESESELVLELKLHNWLCDNVIYDDSTRDVFSADEIPTNLTAIGSLTKGAANCQGYADGFYVLGTLAGFTVDRQYCQENNGGYHTMNTILIDDKWSIVDVTFDDNSCRIDDKTYPNGHMFNVGKDIANQEYNWPAEFEHHPIVEETTENYFYYTAENETTPIFGQAFENVEDMGKAVVEQWKDGRRSFHLMLKGSNAEWSDVKQSILNAKEAEGLENMPSFFTTAISRGENSFYTIDFDEE